MKTKTFDCVKMKREAAEKIYQQIKTMTLEEELRFWNSTSEGMENAKETPYTRAKPSPTPSTPPTPTPAS